MADLLAAAGALLSAPLPLLFIAALVLGAAYVARHEGERPHDD